MSKGVSIGGIVLACIATILFIVVAATPSYYSTNGVKIGAFKNCINLGALTFGHSSVSHTFHTEAATHPFHIEAICDPIKMTSQEFQQCVINNAPGNGITITTSRPIPTLSPTCNLATMTMEQYQQCLLNSVSAGAGGITTTKPTCSLTTMSDTQYQQCICTTYGICSTSGSNNGGSNGGSNTGGLSISSGETCSTNSVCNGNQCQRQKAVQAFLIIAILTAVATIICGILYVIGSSDMMSLIGCVIAIASFLSGLISIAIVGDTRTSGYDIAYGFYLHLVATLMVLISSSFLFMAYTQRGSKVLTNTSYRV